VAILAWVTENNKGEKIEVHSNKDGSFHVKDKPKVVPKLPKFSNLVYNKKTILEYQD